MRNLCSARDQQTKHSVRIIRWDLAVCESLFEILLILIFGINAHLNPNHAGILPNSIAYIKRLRYGFENRTYFELLFHRSDSRRSYWFKTRLRMYKPDVENEILLNFLRLRGRLILHKNMNNLLKIQKGYLYWFF